MNKQELARLKAISGKDSKVLEYVHIKQDTDKEYFDDYVDPESMQEKSDEFRKDDSLPDREYRVGFWYTECGIAKVKAQSPKEAEDKLFEFLGESGDLNELDYECTDRDYGTQDANLW